MYPLCQAMSCHSCFPVSMPRRLCFSSALCPDHVRTRAQLLEVKWEDFLRAEALKEAINNWKLAFPGEASAVYLSRSAIIVLVWSQTCAFARYDLAHKSNRCSQGSLRRCMGTHVLRVLFIRSICQTFPWT